MDLKELLGEDLYKQVAEKAGENKIAIVSDGNWFPKDKFNGVNDDLKDLKKQLKDRDTQLEDLKAKATGNEDLQKTIQDLQADNDKIKSEYEAQIQQKTFDFTMQNALKGAKARNPKAVQALLDKESIKLDGENLLGLDDQLKNLKESDPYLFEEEKQEEPGKPKFSTGQHQGSGNLDAFSSVLLGKSE